MREKTLKIVARIIVAFIFMFGFAIASLLLGLVVKGAVAVWGSIL